MYTLSMIPALSQEQKSTNVTFVKNEFQLGYFILKPSISEGRQGSKKGKVELWQGEGRTEGKLELWKRGDSKYGREGRTLEKGC